MADVDHERCGTARDREPLARLKAFWREQERRCADPWSAEDDAAAKGDDALPLCPYCLTPQEGAGWFCAKCGASVGPYNNSMPYLYIFSIGDALRSGMSDGARRSPFTAFGYAFLALAAMPVLAPVYLVRLFAKWRRYPRGGPVEDGAERGPEVEKKCVGRG